MAFVYDEEKLERLEEVAVEYEGSEVPYPVMEALADEFMFPTRSVGAKLRALGVAVAKKNTKSKWPEVEADVLVEMIENGNTDEEIAEKLGKTINQVRGKALSMQLIEKLVKVTKAPSQKTFNDEDSDVVEAMAIAGDYIEDIAEKVNKSVRQVRGKLLSMKLSAPQREKKAPESKIYTDEVVSKITTMVEAGETAEDIAEELSLKIIGLKSKLGKLGLKTPDMGGKSKGYSEDDYATLETMCAQGATAEDIAKAIGRTAQSVRIVAGRRKVKFNDVQETTE